MGWQQNVLENTTFGAPVAYRSAAGYMWNNKNTEHIVYVGVDAHVHEYYYDTQWHYHDLTVASGGGAPPAKGKATGYVWENDNSEHVVYWGTDDHIHELYYTGRWWYNDLTNASGGAPPAAGDPMGYVFQAQNTQHVVYRGTDNHIHELYYDGQWHYNDLNSVSGGAPPAAGDPMGYMFQAENTQHVVYRGTGDHIYELWYDGQWHHHDLNSVSGGAPPAAGEPAGYVSQAENTQHVVYRGTDNHIYELYYDTQWHYHDLTNVSGGAPPAYGDPVGYVFQAENTQHVFYGGFGENTGEGIFLSRIYELWYDGQWHYNDLLTKIPNAGLAAFPGDRVSAFTWETAAQRSQHVVFRGVFGDIYEYYFVL